jgi:predicted nucleic acid-binding protein
MKAVVNTTPLISLACVGRLDLLQRFFGGIIVPEAVYQEIKAKPGYAYVEIDQPWIEIRDENRGYRVARQVGLPVVRTLSLLLRAKEKGYVVQIKPILEEMITRGRWYSPAVCQAILSEAGEI